MGNPWLGGFTTTIKCLALLHIVHSRYYEFTQTKGESMLPTLNRINDYVHVSKWYRNGRDCRMGDCIVLYKPNDPKKRVCKRITGMPGDYILVDPSLDDFDAKSTYIKVPKGHVWVTGDNLAHSLDSRSYNVVPMGLIVGKIIAANDFNKPVWDPDLRILFGFRWIVNNFEHI